jgi:hypothetical protein
MKTLLPGSLARLPRSGAISLATLLLKCAAEIKF